MTPTILLQVWWLLIFQTWKDISQCSKEFHRRFNERGGVFVRQRTVSWRRGSFSSAASVTQPATSQTKATQRALGYTCLLGLDPVSWLFYPPPPTIAPLVQMQFSRNKVCVFLPAWLDNRGWNSKRLRAEGLGSNTQKNPTCFQLKRVHQLATLLWRRKCEFILFPFSHSLDAGADWGHQMDPSWIWPSFYSRPSPFVHSTVEEAAEERTQAGMGAFK